MSLKEEEKRDSQGECRMTGRDWSVARISQGTHPATPEAKRTGQIRSWSRQGKRDLVNVLNL